jgi:hypothetical protein
MLECCASEALERAAKDQGAQPSSHSRLPQSGHLRLGERAQLVLQLPDHLLPRRKVEDISSAEMLTWSQLGRP